jgi:hypothetical protein
MLGKPMMNNKIISPLSWKQKTYMYPEIKLHKTVYYILPPFPNLHLRDIKYLYIIDALA